MFLNRSGTTDVVCTHVQSVIVALITSPRSLITILAIPIEVLCTFKMFMMPTFYKLCMKTNLFPRYNLKQLQTTK